MLEMSMDRELQELLTTLKSVERKVINSRSAYNARDSFLIQRDIFIIHMIVIGATSDMDSALDALAKTFRNGDDAE